MTGDALSSESVQPAPENYNAKAKFYEESLRRALGWLPDWGWTDRLLKQKAGEALKDILPTNTLSGELMHRCIDQRKTPFTREDLRAVNPALDQAFLAMIHAAPEVQELRPGQKIVWNTSQQDSDHSEDLKSAKPSPAHDLRRALGNVTASVKADGSLEIRDFFDFKNPGFYTTPEDPNRWQGPETTKKLLEAALRAHTEGNEYTRNLYVGRIFCPEPADNQQGPQSIPIKLTFSAQEVTAVPNMPNRRDANAPER